MRIAIVINQGILDTIYTDNMGPLSAYLQDVDGDAEDPVLYSELNVVLDPDAVERIVNSAEEQ